MLRALGVIPARYASTRFRGKPLAPLGNRTLLEEVWRKTDAATGLSRLIVATDDQRIVESCRDYGAEVWMTSRQHLSGTDRAAEVLQRCRVEGEAYDIVLNVQGDEPMISPSSLDRLLKVFETAPATEMATLCEALNDEAEFQDPNVVKVVTDHNGRAMYFSRAPIPYPRNGLFDPGLCRKHQGIYAYRAEVLEKLTQMPPTGLETAENLEQLRALAAGYTIRVIESDFHSIGVDTPEDLKRVAAYMAGTTEDTVT
jgi:3-deoxy-manno-octulosonate cytidylyltransferase (CMP-KDO synthetase)